jgi:hypothetical protein
VEGAEDVNDRSVSGGLALQRFATAAPAPPDKTLSRHLQVAKDQIDKKEWAVATALLQQLLPSPST